MFCPFCGVPQKVTADYDYIQDEIGANVDKIKTGDHASRKRKPRDNSNDMNKTRNIYGNDTIYEDRRPSGSYAQDNRRRDPRDRYYDDYDNDDYEYEYEDWGMESGGGNKGVIITTIIIAIICLAGIAAIIYFGLKPQEKNNIVDVIKCYNSSNTEVSEGEEFDGKLEVTLVSEQGYQIRYTTDGTDVDENSPVYSGAVTSDKTIELKAKSYNEDGKESGSLAVALVVAEMPETTEAETTTAAASTDGISKEDAEKVVEKALVESGAMQEDYSTEDGGFINLIHAGQTTIDDTEYFVVQADYYDADGNIWETTYYGVDSQQSGLAYLEKQDDHYIVVE